MTELSEIDTVDEANDREGEGRIQHGRPASEAARGRASRSEEYREARDEYAEIRALRERNWIAAHIRERRYELDLTQKEVAERADTSHSFISKLEGRDHIPTIPVLQRILAVLDEELLIGTQPRGTRVRSVNGPANARARVRGHLPVLPYFVLTFVWTWSWWWLAAASGLSATDGGPGSLLYLLGVLGPLVGAAWIVRRGGRSYRREFLRRIWDPRRIPARWWLALVAVGGGPAVVAAVVASMTGAAGTVPDYNVGVVVAMVVAALVAGLAEEPGWRGAASDAWQARTRPVWAATAIGVLWAIWHLPLAFVEGHYYHDLGFGSLRFWLAYLILVQMGVLFVWLANGSGGSILIAILAHTGLNVGFGLGPSSATRDVVAFVIVAAATAAVIAATRGQLRFGAGSANWQPALLRD